MNQSSRPGGTPGTIAHSGGTPGTIAHSGVMPGIVAPPRIAVLRARWHADLVDRAALGFIARMAELGIDKDRIALIDLPGAFEIPLEAQRLAKAGRHAAVVAMALVVDGGIYRHDFVAATVVQAFMRVQLDTGMPEFSVVLTPHYFHEHDTHQSFFADHLVTKGREAADACMATPAARQRLSAPAPTMADIA